MTILKTYTPILLLTLLTIMSFKCSFDSPKAPSWDVPVNIPLVDRKYSVQELVDEFDEVYIKEDGLLGFQYEGEFDTTFVGSRIRIPDVEKTVQIDVGSLDIPYLGKRNDVFRFPQLWTDAQANDGATVAIPEFTFKNVQGETLGNPDFYSAVLLQGRANVIVTNKLPIAVQNVVLSYLNLIDGTIIISTAIDSIASMESITAKVAFTDISIPQTSVWVISGQSDGSKGQEFPININDSIEVQTELTDLYVHNLTAHIPPLDLSQQKMIDFGDQVIIHEAGVNQGKLVLRLENNMPLGANVNLTLSQIKHSQTGAPLNVIIYLNPHQSVVKEIDLADYIVTMTPKPDGSGAETVLDIIGTTDPSGDEFITLGEENYVAITALLKDVTVGYVRGIVEEQEIDLKSIHEDIDLPDFADKPGRFTLNSGRLTLTLISSVNVPIKFSGQIIGYNRNGQSSSLPIDHQLNRGTTAKPESTIIVFDEDDNLVNILNLPPIRLESPAVAWIGDGVTEGEINSSDFVWGKYRLETAAMMNWSATTIKADTSEIIILPEDWDGDEDDDRTTLDAEVTKYLQSAKLLVHIENHLPVGSEVLFRMHTDSSKLFTSPVVTLGPVKLNAPQVDNQGRVSQPNTSEQEIEMSADDMELFKNSGTREKPIFIATDVILDESPNQGVAVFMDDYIHIKALATFVAHIRDDTSD